MLEEDYNSETGGHPRPDKSRWGLKCEQVQLAIGVKGRGCLRAGDQCMQMLSNSKCQLGVIAAICSELVEIHPPLTDPDQSVA